MTEHLDDICDAFEQAWVEDDCPFVAEYLGRLVDGDVNALATELIKIDLERRRGRHVETRSVADYLASFPQLELSEPQLIDLIETEVSLSLLYGEDLRPSLLEAHPAVTVGLSDLVDSARRRVDWPKLSVVRDGQTRLEVKLDREAIVGRQAEIDPPSESVVTLPGYQRVVVAGSVETSISRKQLKVKVVGPNKVRFTNQSRNRAILVEEHGILNAQATVDCCLPVSVPLSDRLLIVVTGTRSGATSRPR